MVATFFLLCDDLACFLALSLIQSKSLKPLGDNSKFCHPQGDQSFYSFIFPIAWNSDLIVMPYSGCFSFLAVQESHLWNFKNAQLNQNFWGWYFLQAVPSDSDTQPSLRTTGLQCFTPRSSPSFHLQYVYHLVNPVYFFKIQV